MKWNIDNICENDVNIVRKLFIFVWNILSIETMVGRVDALGCSAVWVIWFGGSSLGVDPSLGLEWLGGAF